MKIKLTALLILALLLIWSFNDRLFFNSDVNPIQHRIGNPFGAALLLNDGDKYSAYKITALASYDINARVLSKKQYSNDPESAVAKYDLALGWGEMSKNEVLKDIEITQDHRWYMWKATSKPIISLRHC